MKILILSDIHANWYALEAILASESYDALIFLGDAVDFGPNPKECVRFLMESPTGRFHGVRGDHDHALAYGINCRCSKELSELSSKTREWGEGFITGKEVGFLRRLPFDSHVTLDGLSFHLVHGSPSDRLYKTINPNPGEFEIEDEFGDINTDFILAGHSHKPYIKHSGKTTILNPGSVGQPRDFNPRASYAVIENGEATIKRTKYDIEKTVKDLGKSSLPKDVIRELISILVIGGVVKRDEMHYC
jgi:putative phosphoesterase